MKKKLMAIPYFLLWIFYFMVTIPMRNRYERGVEKGMHCYKSRPSGFMGESIDFYYDPEQRPYREYSTWSEFWKARGY